MFQATGHGYRNRGRRGPQRSWCPADTLSELLRKGLWR